MTVLSDAPPTTRSASRAFSSTLGAEVQLSFRGRPGGVAIGSGGTKWVSEPLGGTIWQMTDRQMVPVVERPRNGTDLVPTQTVRLLSPSGIAYGPDGTLYVADPSENRVCSVAPDGLVRVVAGGANGYRDGR